MKNDKLKELKQSVDDKALMHQMNAKSVHHKAEVCIRLIHHLKKDNTWDEMATISGISRSRYIIGQKKQQVINSMM